MLLSMTGYGEAHSQEHGLTVAAEVRTINNRYFKLNVRCSEGYGSLEGEIEALVRKHVRRGTVQVNLRIDRAETGDAYHVNRAVLEAYRRQIGEVAADWGQSSDVSFDTLLLLPGAVTETTATADDVVRDWPVARQTLLAALEGLDRMRADEGRAMAADLRANCEQIADELEKIAARSGEVVEGYRARLSERIEKALAEFEATLDPADLMKEVSVFAERSDISEEIVRLRSHLTQFEKFLKLTDGAGRKLEFLTQEMFRETNTIGSKANDVDISRHVIEIKAAIERIREMIQNVE